MCMVYTRLNTNSISYTPTLNQERMCILMYKELTKQGNYKYVQSYKG